jgi:hypothetical protein
VPDPVERGELERQLALTVGSEPGAVHAAVRRVAADRRGVPPDRDAAAVAGEESARPPAPGGPDERWAQTLARLLLDHPELARGVDAEELAELLPSPPWHRLLPALVELCDAEGGADVAALAERLDAESAAALRAVAIVDAADAEPHDAARARDHLEQTLARLRRRRLREIGRTHRQRFLAGEMRDEHQLLAEMQRVIDEKRKAQGLSSGPGRAAQPPRGPMMSSQGDPPMSVGAPSEMRSRRRGSRRSALPPPTRSPPRPRPKARRARRSRRPSSAASSGSSTRDAARAS